LRSLTDYLFSNIILIPTNLSFDFVLVLGFGL
jgi:hypothetical protein